MAELLAFLSYIISLKMVGLIALFIERSVLAAGSSWHAAGGEHALNADPNMSALQGYTLDLLSKIQGESGQDIGLHMTGGITIASTPDR